MPKIFLVSTFAALLPLTSNGFANETETPTIKWGGRIQADYLWVDQDTLEHLDGEEVRRARLYISGELSKDWDYKAQYDFKGDGEWKDLYLGYQATPNTYLQMGQIFEMVGLEGFTSSKNLTFIERSLPVAFVPDRALGVSMTYSNQNWMFASGLYGQNLRDTNRSTFGASSRLAWSNETNDQTWHLGASLAYREPDNDEYRVRTRPETHVTDTRLIDTSTLGNVDNYTTQGLELAWVNGSWSLQHETMKQHIHRSGQGDIELNSWYLLGSYFLTGEQRNYSQKWGVFSGTKPTHDYGAFEIAARYSEMDLNDPNYNEIPTIPGNYYGGRMKNWTLGLNWYLNAQLKIVLNHIISKSEKGDIIDKPNFSQIRLQYVF